VKILFNILIAIFATITVLISNQIATRRTLIKITSFQAITGFIISAIHSTILYLALKQQMKGQS